ncbi:MAG: hypothetical protein FJ297_16280 [Planctomycetes bacterium]|nr:hypothetical protein [Planctomycetota bacterium]
MPFDVMRQAMRNTQPERSDERIVFNGKLLWSDRGERIERDGVSDDVVMIRNLETFAPTSALSPLHYCGIVLPLPAIPRENKSALARSLYHLLMDNQFRVSEMDQIVDDVPCVTLESKTDDEDSTKVWLAPRMGYAVVRRDSFRNGLPSFAVRCASFEEFALGIWLPREIQLTAFGWRDIHPGPFVGKPLHQTTIRLNQIALNDPESDKFLSLSPAPGKLVVDSSDVPRIPSEGIAVPNYIMPANEKDLDSVRRHAVKRLQGDRWGIGFRVFVGTTALIAGALTTWFVWRRRRG